MRLLFLVPSLLSPTSSASLGPVQRDPPVIVSPVELCGTPPRLLVRSLLDDERGVAADGMKAVVRYAGRGARCSKASLSITLGELVIASIDAVVRRLHRTVIKRPTVPLQEDANVIGPLPPGLYKVAAEAQEAGCSIVTEPIPLVGATQRRHTAWLPINWLWQRKAAQSPMGRQRQPQSALNGPCCPVEDFNVPLQPRGLAATRKRPNDDPPLEAFLLLRVIGNGHPACSGNKRSHSVLRVRSS